MSTNPPSDEQSAITLYRVGFPSIGETYGRTWTWQRDTDGLGTGIYAFAAEDAADRNTVITGQADARIFTLPEALGNPVELRTYDAMVAFARFWRKCDRVRSLTEDDILTWDEAFDRAGTLPISLNRRRGGREAITMGGSIRSTAWDALMESPQLQEMFGLDAEEMTREGLRATRAASRNLDFGDRNATTTQPANHLLWPDYDGVYPHPGAGGNEGTWGCVIFKEKIDQCVGRETTQGEEVAVSELKPCFERWSRG